MQNQPGPLSILAKSEFQLSNMLEMVWYENR